MAEFAKYYTEFLSKFFSNFKQFFASFFGAIGKIFTEDIPDYFRQLTDAMTNFDVLSWIVFVLITIVNFALAFFIFYFLFQIVRRYIIFRAKEVEKDKLMEEIAKLKAQSDELVKEKSQLMALKLNAVTAQSANAANGNSGTLVPAIIENAVVETGKIETSKSAEDEISDSRFTKLIDIDKRYARTPHFVYMNESDMLTLKEIVDRFVDFAASQLKLYYDTDTIRTFFAALATSKIVILEGISGTGKTSLPYAMGKFFNNQTSIISVQPSWRDRSELLGYFNEFTKKFNETDFLKSLYEATKREDPNLIVLDEMNLARIEYYFAEFLSVMEMPDKAEWKIDVVPSSLPSDPENVVYGKLLVPQNVWFVGTANNDDSTFTITDKVYDRAVAIELNNKADYFDAKMTESLNCSYRYLETLFEKAQSDYSISEANLDKLKELDKFIQTKFRIAFGNRIMKQIKLYVPTYIAAGGQELTGLDFMIASKILRKFNALNLPFLQKELSELKDFLDKKFGKGKMKHCLELLNELNKRI